MGGWARRDRNVSPARYRRAMQREVLTEISLRSLERAVGTAAVARGLSYARERAVREMHWDPAEGVLHGRVRGQGTNVYATTAHLSAEARPEFEWGDCSCPVAFNCKHVAALILTTLFTQPTPPERQAQPVSWEQSLQALLDVPSATVPARSGGTWLAMELSLTGAAHPATRSGPMTAGSPLKLIARLVRPGKNGGWVGGSLSWSRLSSLAYDGNFRPAQVRLLREIYALSRSEAGQADYGSYRYGDDKTIDLSAFGSRQLWPLLEEAEETGLQLVHHGRHGLVDWRNSAEFCVDVTRTAESGALMLAPLIRINGEGGRPVVPVQFMGADGHGVILADPADPGRSANPGQWRFRLARLDRPVPPALQQMALSGQRLDIPAAQQSRFRDEYYPRLRHAATVTSSDGSFTAPVISAPTLVLAAAYAPGHHLGIGWEWSYEIDGSPVRADVDAAPAAAGYRDLDAEQAIVAGFCDELARFGLWGTGPVRTVHAVPASGTPAPLHRAQFDGIDTLRVTTELLPLLAGHPRVAIEVTGEVPDYREAGDSLQIAVSAGERPDDSDWFDLGITVTIEGREVPFRDLFMALSRGNPVLLLPDGAHFSLDKPELRTLARLIEEARALQDAPGNDLRISRFQAGFWAELAGLGLVSEQADAWRRQVAGLLAAGGVGQVAPPASLAAQLRPYQLDGFSWLTFLWQHGLGGILADDMGLGKTLQALALICHAREVTPEPAGGATGPGPATGAAGAPFLVVAPTSVVPNWQAESARFAPGLKVVAVTDTMARRGQPLGEVIAGADAVVTSYTLLRLDIDAYAAVDWSGMILDEAQYAKNHQSKIYQCTRRVRAPFKVAVTGTPMENNLMELWSLLSITAPGLFPSPARFRDYYAKPIERGHPELLGQLRRRIRPLVMRRTKEQVAADLPAKQEQILEIDLHPRHRKLYQTHLQRERQKVLGLISDMNANRFTIFRSLTLLRQLSLHAALVDDAHADIPSGKIDALLAQLREVAGGGHRALVFSQFTRFLDQVRARLDDAGMPYCYLDGSTRHRGAVVQQFKDGAAPVFLISLKAGGFGLNLTEADYCFILDPWWNPAVEAQAVDRTHRIGQTRNVMVYRLIAADTIESKVMELKAKKAELFASVIDSGDVFSAGLDADDIRGLFE